MCKQTIDNALKRPLALVFIILFIFLSGQSLAEEKIIEQEKMSFDRCINVIKVSSEKLSITPEVSDLSDNKRAAVFTMSDGTLTITCDGEKGLVIVTTKMN